MGIQMILMEEIFICLGEVPTYREARGYNRVRSLRNQERVGSTAKMKGFVRQGGGYLFL